jgi:hypothetical protein
MKGDPLPYSTQIAGDKKILFIPHKLDVDSNKECFEFTAMISVVAAEYGFEIQITKRECLPAFWNTVKALRNVIEGFYFCLMRDEISPSDNVPTQFKTGWAYAQWYAYSAASGDQSGGSYVKINRSVKLSEAQGAAWTSKESLADLTRLGNTLRILASQAKLRIGPVRKYLKGKGFFVQTNAGKKPSAGLYLQEELERVTLCWSQKVEAIEQRYNAIPEHFSQLGPGDTMATILEVFNIENPTNIKKIEEARTSRIPDLLVDAPKVRGQKPEKVIAKGAGLPEKLIAIGGGDSVRTIGKVMYSPLIRGLTKNTFIDLVIREVNGILRNRGSLVATRIAQLAAVNPQPAELETLTNAESYVTIAAQTYLEIIPDRRGNSTWDGVFPV